MLAASAVAGAGQKLDAGTAFQDDLFPAQRRPDLQNIFAQLRRLEEIPHFLKGLGGRLLQMRCVDDGLVEHEHPGPGAPLHQQALAVLAGNAPAAGRCRPFAGSRPAQPVVQNICLPRVQVHSACPQDAGCIHSVRRRSVRRDSFGRLLASHHAHVLRGPR